MTARNVMKTQEANGWQSSLRVCVEHHPPGRRWVGLVSPSPLTDALDHPKPGVSQEILCFAFLPHCSARETQVLGQERMGLALMEHLHEVADSMGRSITEVVSLFGVWKDALVHAAPASRQRASQLEPQRPPCTGAKSQLATLLGDAIRSREPHLLSFYSS